MISKKKNHAGGFLALVDDAKSRIREMTLEELGQSQETTVLIDVREESEWAAGHIPGAVHLGKGILERDIEALVLNRDQKVVLYCGGGFRSALAADNLQKMGYRRVFSLAGGIRRWRERNA